MRAMSLDLRRTVPRAGDLYIYILFSVLAGIAEDRHNGPGGSIAGTCPEYAERGEGMTTPEDFERLQALLSELKSISGQAGNNIESKYLHKACEELAGALEHARRKSVGDAEGTAERIIEAARNALAEVDYRKHHSVSMRQIAKRAGVAPATIYQHYSSKHKLLATVIRHETGTFVAGARKSIRPGAGTTERVREHTRYMFQYFEANPNMAALVYLEVPFELYLESGVAREHASVFTSIIRQGVVAGELRNNLDTRMATHIYFGAFQRLVTAWLLREKSYSLSSMAGEFNEMIERCLR